MTLLPTLKTFLSVRIKFLKAPCRMISQNLGSFQGKCLWQSCVPAKAVHINFPYELKHDFTKFTEVYSEPSLA